ncbi:ATP-binding protein [Adlercreutzia sp. ZJ242]|uniref:ATP-binding protein n=1 Tax=Adlercreutzia sp. ZJ242 TaxID=2709409 RepID=UPI0013EC96C1|nr:ATP-binding protein [Adlercreutzia sp. ZJ242]
MLTEEHFDLFRQFRIKAMGDKLREMVDDASFDKFTFEEKMEMLLDAESTARRDRKVAKYVKQAGFKTPSACVEDVVYLPDRTINKDRILRYSDCGWVERCEVMVIISKTGCGKSFLCQAFGNAACRKLIPTRYTRLADACDQLNRARAAGDGSYYEKMDAYKTVPLLILDDFMTTPISTQNSVDLFEIMEAREGRCATIIASQLEPNEWYLRIEGELMADSILNRIATGARYIDLEGPNMREYFAKKRGAA